MTFSHNGARGKKGWEPFVHAYKVCAVIHFSERGIHPQLTTVQTERSDRLTFD